MNNIRWTVTFKTIKERTAVVSIADADYNAEPQAIEPALDTVTIDTLSKSLTDSIRTSTGYLRIIDNDDLTGILPAGILDRPAELRIDGNLYWRGYITPATYTAGWEATPAEQSLPLQSALSVLSGITITEQGDTLPTMAGLIAEALRATGFAWQGIIIPVQMTGVGNQTVTVPELRMRVSRYNFLTPSSVNPDDPDYTTYDGRTYLDILTAICQYFGWQAVEHADTLIMLSNCYDVTTYAVITMDELDAIAADYTAATSGTTVAITIHPEDILQWDGLEHTYSVIPGKRKVTITANPNVVEDLSPALDTTGRAVWEDTRVGSAYLPTARNVVLQPAVDLTLHRWEIIDDRLVEVPYQYPTSRDDMRETLTAQLLRNDSFFPTTDRRINYNYTDYIRLAKFGNTSVLKLVTMQSHEAGVFPPGGALCFSCDIRSSYCKDGDDVLDREADTAGLTAWGPGNCLLYLSIGVGNLWYTERGWVENDDPVRIPKTAIYAGDRSYDWKAAPQTVGRVENTKTIDDPYNGAEGYLLKIDRMLSGKLTIIFYTYDYEDSMPAIRRSPALFINNIRLNYYSDKYNRHTQPLHFAALTGKDYQDTLDVTLQMAGSKFCKPGKSTIYYADERISPDNCPTYGAEKLLPEEYLLRGLTNMISSPTRQMQLQVELADFHPSDRINLDGRTHLISGMQTDIYNESTTLTLSSYGQN